MIQALCATSFTLALLLAAILFWWHSVKDMKDRVTQVLFTLIWSCLGIPAVLTIIEIWI